MEKVSRRLHTLFELPGVSRNAAMEGLRAIAVILVFFVHYHSVLASWIRPGAPTAELAYGLRWVGNIGVDLFFILSGYLIYGAVASKKFQLRKFMVRRVQRIYPTFLVLLVVYLGLSFVVPNEGKLPPGAWPAALYVLQNALLLPGMFDIPPLITVSWSLSYEVFFYLALPVVVAVLGLRTKTRPVRLALFALLAVMIGVLPLVGGGHVQMMLFVAGMALFELREAHKSLTPRAARMLRHAATGLAVVLLPATYFLFFAFVPYSEPMAFVIRTVWLSIALGFVVSITLTEQGPVAKLCSQTPMRWLGNMSYSYYLLHGLVLKAVSMVLLRVTGVDHTHPLLFWALMPVAFAATLVCSAVLFGLVEKPFSLRDTGTITVPQRALAPIAATPAVGGPTISAATMVKPTHTGPRPNA